MSTKFEKNIILQLHASLLQKPTSVQRRSLKSLLNGKLYKLMSYEKFRLYKTEKNEIITKKNQETEEIIKTF